MNKEEITNKILELNKLLLTNISDREKRMIQLEVDNLIRLYILKN
jgi:hypothetical protein